VNYDLKKLKQLRSYMEVARQVKEVVLSIDPKAEVYVFGSTVKGMYTAASDIDILVVSERKDLEYKIKVESYRRIDAPIEIHFTTPREYEQWYKRFIDAIRRV